MAETAPTSEQRYQQRIARVVAALARDPMASYSLDALAAIAHFSPFHFHRIYRGITGETVATTLRRMRLGSAARSLAVGRDSVTQIALAAGYDSPQAFTRAFREFSGHAPLDFRRRMSHWAAGDRTDNAAQAPQPGSRPVRIVERTARRIAALAHSGPAAAIKHTHQRMRRLLGDAPVVETLGISWGDASEPETFRYYAAVVLGAGAPTPAGLEALELPGGPYALHELTGPYAQITPAATALYAIWLPASGYEPDDRPLIEIYRNSPRDTPAHALRTDLLMPIRPLGETR